MTVVKLIAGALLVYLLVVGLVALAQDRLIFPRWAIVGAPAPPERAERLDLALPTGDRLAGLRLAPAAAQAGAPLVLGFGGNAWDADALAILLADIYPDHEVAAFHYRGYGPSTGWPSARALLDDALVVHDHLAALTGRPIVPVGISLGAGPAAHLAARRPVAGLVLVTPFDSLAALARTHYPWAPVELLLRHRMDIAEAVAATAAPVALISAERDTIVPPERSGPVRAAAADLVLDRVVRGAGHNDLFASPAFVEAMRDALRGIEKRVRPAGPG